MIEYLDCKFTITKNNKVKYEIESILVNWQFEGDLCNDELTKLTVRRLNRFIGGRTEFCQQADLQALGLHLYHILFDGKTKFEGKPTDLTLGERFVETYERFESEFEKRKQQTRKEIPDYRLRVTLIFEEGMEELAGYPWEFLYVPRPNKTGFFITGEQTELILTRFIQEPTLVNMFWGREKKLVIVVAWSQPKELGPASESDTIIAIKGLAEKIEKELTGYNIEVIPLPQATHENFKKLIEERKPQIVHFIGHGRIKNNASEIALMKTAQELDMAKAEIARQGLRGDPEQAKWVSSDSMRALFITAPPRLVFLQACNSAKAPNSLEVFKGTAKQVLRARVPFVVAMQYEISNEDATDFAKAFYRGLGDGLSIDEAVKMGRIELGKKEPSWGHPRFGIPVVYLQSKDNVIVLREESEESTTRSPKILSNKHDCPYLDCG